MARRKSGDADPAPEPVRQAPETRRTSTPIAGEKLAPLGKPKTHDERITASIAAHGSVTVTATAIGEYLYQRRRVGDVFEIPAQRWAPVYTEDEIEHFRLPERLLGKKNPKAAALCYQGSWMALVPKGTPRQQTGPNQAIDRERQAIHGRGGQAAPDIDSLAE